MNVQKRKGNPGIRGKCSSRGSSLPLVISVGAFLLAFSLAMVYTAGLLLSGADRKVDEERCYQLASGFAGEIDRELHTEGSEFQRFADKFLEDKNYNSYQPDKPSTLYTYKTKDEADASYGNVRLRLRKEVSESSAGNEAEEETGAGDGFAGFLPSTDASAESNFTALVKECQEKTFQRYFLTVEVIAEWKNLSYNYSTEYLREDRYHVSFFHNGKQILWDEAEKCWREGTNLEGAKYDAWIGSEEKIRYEYRTKETPSFKEYRNVHAQKGETEP